MAKQRIRLTESQLNRVVKESVRRILGETIDDALTYEFSISYFLSNEEEDSEENADELQTRLYSSFPDVEVDVYDDGEDYCVDAVIQLQLPTQNNAAQLDKAFTNALRNKGLDEYTWDYHYIKGVDNDFYWQP